MSHPVLWQFRLSHYNEKARWALDYKRLPHVRRSVFAGPHMLRMLWLSGQRSVPVLQLNGKGIADSTRIIAAVEAHQPTPPLYPADPAQRERALALEEYFDEELGPYLRRVFFFDVLSSDPDYLPRFIGTGFTTAAQRRYGLVFPMIREVMKRDMQINAAAAEVARGKVLAALDHLEREVQPNGYLVGDGFTVADLTAAALLSPLVQPAEFPYPFPDHPPETAVRYREALASRRGFAWVQETYRRHRGTSAEIASP